MKSYNGAKPFDISMQPLKVVSSTLVNGLTGRVYHLHFSVSPNVIFMLQCHNSLLRGRDDRDAIVMVLLVASHHPSVASVLRGMRIAESILG